MRSSGSAVSMLALVGLAGASHGCGAFGSTDDTPAANTGSAGVALLGAGKASGVGLRELAVTAPAGGHVGSTVWAVLATSETNTTPPPGFDVVNTDKGFACGPYGSTMGVYVHTIAEGEPSEYKFLFSGITVAAISLVVLDGLVTGSIAVETSSFKRVPMSPFEAPKASAGGPAYAILSYMIVGEPSLTWPLPAGTTRLVDANAIAIYGREMQAGNMLDVEPVTSSKPESCGFVHVAIVRRK